MRDYLNPLIQNTMTRNDTKIAKEIEVMFGSGVKVSCDDGNVHVNCESREVADNVQTQRGHVRTNDGVQEGSVVVWVGDEMVYEND